MPDGAWGLALAAFAAGSIMPFPSEGVLAALVGSGRDPWAMAAVATAFNVLGGATMLALGRQGRGWARRRVGERTYDRAERWFARFGPWLLLMTWVPWIGDAFPLAAGALGVPWRVALPLMALGKGARYAVVAAAAARLL